jgi:hypothetical protein
MKVSGNGRTLNNMSFIYVVLIDIFGKLEQHEVLREWKGTYLYYFDKSD